MAAETMPTVIDCRCGQQLRLAGATPGRVGRCPACGTTFRVPEPAASRPSTARVKHPSASPAGYDLEAGGSADEESTFGPTASLERVAPRDRARALGEGSVDGRGLVARPGKPEKSPFVSLLYPIWDPKGLVWLLFMPPIMTVTSLAVFGGFPVVAGGGVNSLFLPFVCVMVVGLLLASTRLIQGLSGLLVASAEGEIHHPPGADIDFGDMFLTFLRWGLAWGLGVGIMVLPALAYYRGRVDPGLGSRLAAVLIAASGGVYSLMALLSVELHNDLMGLSPALVVRGAVRSGLGYLWTLAGYLVAVVVGTLIVEGIYRLSSFGLILLATWAGWIYAQYASMALMRLLGRGYHRRANRIGWFRVVHRPREQPLGPPPPPVPDF